MLLEAAAAVGKLTVEGTLVTSTHVCLACRPLAGVAAATVLPAREKVWLLQASAYTNSKKSVDITG